MTSLPQPKTLIPTHRLTWCALAQAVRLADLLLPHDADEQFVYDCIVNAARSGDLYATAEAVFDATLCDWVTSDWREWAHGWIGKVKALIMSQPVGRAA